MAERGEMQRRSPSLALTLFCGGYLSIADGGEKAQVRGWADWPVLSCGIKTGNLLYSQTLSTHACRYFDAVYSFVHMHTSF